MRVGVGRTSEGVASLLLLSFSWVPELQLLLICCLNTLSAVLYDLAIITTRIAQIVTNVIQKKFKVSPICASPVSILSLSSPVIIHL